MEGQEGEIEVRQFFELDDFGPSKAVDRARETGKKLAKNRWFGLSISALLIRRSD